MPNSEDYLDGLLNSITKAKTDVKNATEEAEALRREKYEKRTMIQPEDDFMVASGIKGYTPVEIPRTNLRKVFSEEDFLRSFEEEIESGEADAFLEAFEREIDEEEFLEQQDEQAQAFVEQVENEVSEEVEENEASETSSEEKLSPEIESDTVDTEELMENKTHQEIENNNNELLENMEEIISMSHEKEYEDVGLLPGDEGYENLNASNEDVDNGEESDTVVLKEFEPDELDEISKVDGEPVLEENMLDADLLEILKSEGEDAEGIGELLAVAEGADLLEESKEAFEEQVAEVQASGEHDEKSDLVEKKGIAAIVDKLMQALPFGKKKTDETKVVEIHEKEQIEDYTEENLEILKNLEKTENKEKSSKKNKKKEKKPKKEKKQKTPKEKKPKKEKPPKEPDLSPVISMKYIGIFVVLGASLLAFLYLGAGVVGYQRMLSEANQFYSKGDYISSFECMTGSDIKDKDKEFYLQTRMLADLQKRQKDYETFMQMEEYEYALDALIMGVGRYQYYHSQAESYKIVEQYDEIGTILLSQLQNQFGVGKEQAVELWKMKDREDYTKELKKILLQF